MKTFSSKINHEARVHFNIHYRYTLTLHQLSTHVNTELKYPSVFIRLKPQSHHRPLCVRSLADWPYPWLMVDGIYPHESD